MGVRERKLRDKEALRARILDAARDILASEGRAGLSIRKVAKAVEYSPGTMYLYYKDKDELLLALHVDAFQRKASLFSPLLSISDPAKRLEAMGRAYIEHATSSPADFHLMFVDQCPIDRLQEEGKAWHSGQTALDMLRETIVQGIEEGKFRADLDPDSMSVVLWSLVHGCAMLQFSNRLSMLRHGAGHDRILDDLFKQVDVLVMAG